MKTFSHPTHISSLLNSWGNLLPGSGDIFITKIRQTKTARKIIVSYNWHEEDAVRTDDYTTGDL